MSFEIENYENTPSSLLTQIETSTGRFGTLHSTPNAGSGTENDEVPPGVSERIAQRQVIHTVFQVCMQYTSDMFWKSILYMAARGKFPPGFRYNNGFLNYKKKNNTKNVFIPEDPRMALEVFTNFMHGVGITSNMDVEHQNEKMAYSCSSKEMVSPTVWTQVPKNLRSHYVNSYIQTISNTYNLSPNARISLMNLIHNNIDSGVLGKEQIQVGDFKIINIFGIVYVKEYDSFKIDDALWSRIKSQNPKSHYLGVYNPADYINTGIGDYKTDGQKWRTYWNKKSVTYSNIGNNAMKTISSYIMKGEDIQSNSVSNSVVLLEEDSPSQMSQSQFIVVD